MRPSPRPDRRTGRRRLGRTGGVVLCTLCAVAAAPLAPGPPGAGRPPDGPTRVTSEVFRLAEEAGQARQRYERVRRAARGQRARAEELGRTLRVRGVVRSALRDDVGAAARAQYRTGGFTVGLDGEGAEEALDDPVELVVRQVPAVRRRARLGRMLVEEERANRRLEAEARTLAAARRGLARDGARLEEAIRTAEARLADARGELNAMAQTAVDSGRCAPLDLAGDRAGPSVERAAERSARPARGWVRPVVSYELSAGFGGVGANWAAGHTGQDFAVPAGTPVRAVGDGTVVAAGCGGPFGISLVVEHGGGWYSQYAHLAVPLAEPGRRVRAGQWIGLSGTTGNSTGPHLHFEIRRTPEYGSAVDPVEWLGERGVRL
ncbi:M23 family metallopeptidase [Streptomyces eurocidicus]|uniref:Murein DD-endopeptidase MepM/ murein hydrolase activator NlpD n=1 Tax=Streptomyces eurocidicus TaxID=66423 RepID=A0A7W8BD93_STREU|nr:M23 family metallopeptidase [Streptomyces eurocidicus]MBB5119773.1 murein DD-endopeptidase MepM/ murein hydrolase activator NlpD [Streptomyces eurocidicus]MBF6050795.1 peptidoglycan DD-metalloendopeptidase family protein [Streptomyces eurocidicus]